MRFCMAFDVVVFNMERESGGEAGRQSRISALVATGWPASDIASSRLHVRQGAGCYRQIKQRNRQQGQGSDDKQNG